MPTTIDISNALAGLDQFKKSTARGVLQRALNKAAAPIVSTAKALAPVKTGALRNSIGSKIIRGSAGKTAYASAKAGGASDADAAAAARAANKAAAGKGLSATVRITAAEFYASAVELGTQHAAAKPFLGPAFRSERQGAVDSIASTLKTEIAASAARIAARKARKSA